MSIAPEAPSAPLRLVSLELTGRCQLTCPKHCYAQASSHGSHGMMATDHWHRIISEAAALGTTTVQLIGGEPLLHSGCVELAEHALRLGLRVRVYT
ncbi:radical SAM protein [Streptomyces sp. NBC_00690]|uniref:radical SAM protein n=1 Tax=Streptomyces sp. NBC_00690 TaxID=2975808 RepID=UPI002E2B2793|nr:4Fe-4S cluster-binding domain-containing protein [Streptomyces sp. NBC_00690]